MDINKFFQSKAFKTILCGVAAFAILLFVFKVGVLVGYKKAGFSFRWGENYHRNFGGPREGFFRNFFDDDFTEAHGVSGQIIKIDGSVLIVMSGGNTEKSVLLNDKSVIKRFRDVIQSADLRVEDYIVAIGDPNDAGQIEAKFVRVSPPSFFK